MTGSAALLFIHSICEMLPISSSWHLKYFFHASSHATHVYHIWLLPIIVILLRVRGRKTDFPSLWLMLCAIIPSLFFYFGMKFGIVSKWVFPIEILHIIVGLGLIVAAIAQSSYLKDEQPISAELAWIVMGLGQAVGMRIPGASRFGASLLPGMFFKMPIRQTLVISFALDLACLGSSAYLDVYRNTVVWPSFGELWLASLGLSIGWYFLEKGRWPLIGFLGWYRLCLGIGLICGLI